MDGSAEAVPGVAAFIQAYQPLIATCIGLLVAVIGFGGVVYAQFKVAKNAREERAHREYMAAAARQLDLDHRQKTVIHALSGELSALYAKAVNARNQMAFLTEVGKEIFEDHNSTDIYKYDLPRAPVFFTPIFDNFVSDIGLLSPSMTSSVAKVYSAYQSFAKIENPPGEITISNYLVVLKGYESSLTTVADSTHDLVMRLHLIRLGHNDPGEGKGVEQSEALGRAT